MTQWYLSYDGQQAGPMNLEQARNKASANPNGYAWREGFPSWVPIADVADFRRPPPATPLPERAPPSTIPRPSRADEVDFVIHGHEMQFVEIELDPGESAVAEAGAMMYKDPAIKLETIFGDGSHGSPDSGLMGKLLSAGKRLLTGESLFMTVFTHAGHHGKARVAFAAPYPGNIIPVLVGQDLAAG
ncbi:MAG: AIM24 family protein [Chromatiales bacterium]|nr:AIM24 family protein [Chromatiales bacterium]